MSSAQNSQNLLTNVFRPTYVYSNGSGFTTGLVGTNLKSLDVPTVRTNILDIGDAGSNVYLGTNAGVTYSANPTNLNVSAFGVNAAAGISNVSNSVFIGTAAGLGLSNATDTTVIGANDAVIGTRNVVIGNRDFIFGSNNIVIGSDVSINQSYKLNIANLIIGDIGTDVCGAALIFNSDVRINGVFTSELFDASGLSTTNIAVPGYIRNDPTFGIVMDISQGNFAFTGTGPSRVAGIVFSNGRIDASYGIHGIGYDLSTGLVLSGDISANGSLRLSSASSNVIGGVTLSNTNISYAGTLTGTTDSASNKVGGVTLSNTNISNAGSTTSSNFIGTASASNSIGGVTLNNSNLIVGGYLRNALVPTQFDISGGNISNSATHTASNFIGTATASNSIGGVTLSNTNISYAGTLTGTTDSASNKVGGVTLSNTNISYAGTLTGTTDNTSNKIGGVTLSNTNIVYAGSISNSTASSSNSIGGVTLSNTNIDTTGTITASNMNNQHYIGGVTLSNTNIDTTGTITASNMINQHYIGGVFLKSGNIFMGSNGNSSVPSYTFGNDGSAGMFLITNTTSNALGFAVGGSNRMTISGDVTSVNSIVRTGAGTVSAPSYSFVADPSAGIYRTGTNQIGFTVGGINRVNISNANVGIGTSAPTSVLDLSGGGINLWGLSNNNVARPALTTTGDNIAPAYEIRSRTVNGADGFLRIRAGQTANSASYIDLTGFSSCNDMDRNIVFGTLSTERMRLDVNGRLGIGTSNPTTALVIVGDVSASGFIRTGAGTVSAPSYSFLADPSAGIYRTGTNQIGFTVGGINRVNISNGNVGIGTSGPTAALDIGNIGGRGGLQIYGLSNNNTARPSIDTSAGFPTTTPSYEIRANTTSGGDGFLRIRAGGVGFNTSAQASFIDLAGFSTIPDMDRNLVMGTAGTERMRIHSNGNVGIGTSNPQYLLDISSGTSSQGINVTCPNAQLNVKDPAIVSSLQIYQSSTGQGLYSANTLPIVFSAGGGEKMRIASNGNVGIGTSNPQYSLDICGTIRALEGLKQGTNTWGAYSDQRIKQNIQLADISTCYSIVKNLPLKRFTWDASYVPNLKDRNVVGWIAQDVERVFKRAVQITTDFGFEDLRVLDVDQIYKTMYGALEKVITDKETLETRVVALEQQLSNVFTRLSNAGF